MGTFLNGQKCPKGNVPIGHFFKIFKKALKKRTNVAIIEQTNEKRKEHINARYIKRIKRQTT